MQIKTVSEACSFILEWTACVNAFRGAELSNKYVIPKCVAELNAKLGQLWQNNDHPLNAFPHVSDQPVGLLDIQDLILNPKTYAADDEGVIPLVWENQGVWGFGFRPSEPEQLLVCRDWCDGLQSDFADKWRPVGVTTEDGLVWTLLSNFCFLAPEENTVVEAYEFNRRPEDADRLLWRHPAWDGFDGFWTNSKRSVIFYSGMGLTIRR